MSRRVSTLLMLPLAMVMLMLVGVSWGQKSGRAWVDAHAAAVTPKESSFMTARPGLPTDVR